MNPGAHVVAGRAAQKLKAEAEPGLVTLGLRRCRKATQQSKNDQKTKKASHENQGTCGIKEEEES